MPKLGIKDLGFDEIQSQIDAISQSLEAAAKKLDSFMASGGENTSLKEQVSLLKEIHSLQQKQTSLIKKQTVDNKQLSASEKSLESVKKRQSVLNSKEASEISNINRLNSEKLAKLKEEAIGVTANVGEYQKLQQQYALLKINALNLGAAHGQNSIQFQEAAKKAAQVREQMRLLNKSVGDNTLNVGNYESATFSLVQVFRELPAFAYGAQIGIGSLSNNLVPLFANFKAVANSIDDNTQKVVGYGGALKIFARQLLGLNFIASVGVLIFTLYGKEISNFVKQLLKGKEYVVQMTNTQRALIEQMGELGNATHSTVGDVEFLGIALKKWENNENGIRGSVRNSKALVEKYNDVLGDYYGKVDNVNDALKAYKKYAQDFVDYTIKMNAATEYANKAGEQYLRLRKAQDTLKLFKEEDVDAVKNSLENIKQQYQNYYISLAKERKGDLLNEEETKKAISEANAKFFEAMKSGDLKKGFSDINLIFNSLFDDTSDVYAKNINKITSILYNVVDKKKASSIMKEIATINSATIQMNANRKTAYELMQELISGEDKGRKGREKNEKQYEAEIYQYNRLIAKLNDYSSALFDMANSEQNSFIDRQAYSNDWFTVKTKLLDLELEQSKEKNKRELIDEQEALEKKFKYNEEHGLNTTELLAEYSKALKTISDNRRKKDIEAEDEYYTNMLNLQKEYTSINIKNAEYEISEIQKRYDKANTEEEKSLALKNIEIIQQQTERLKGTKVYFKSAERIIADAEKKSNELQYNAELNSLSEKRKLKEKELEEINKKYDEIKKSDTDYYRNLIITNANAEAEKIRQAGGTQEEIDNVHKAAEKAASNTAGIITMIEEEKKKKKKEIDDEIIKIDEETNKTITKNKEDSAKEQLKIEEWKKNEIERINWELLKTNLDILQSLSDSLFDMEYKRLEDLSELYSRIESERLADIEDREKKGALAADGEVMTKEKAEEEKLKIQTYYDSVQRDIEKQEEERKRQQFLIDQAFAVGNVMMGMAQMIMNPLNVAGALTPLYVALAAAQVGVIMAQSIPYFKDGGVMDSTGYAVLGDGGKREPYISPSGEIGISPSTPTLMKLEKGTKIFPSLDAFERDKTLSLKNRKDENFDFYLILSELRKQNKSNKKVINRGLSTFDAMLLGEKYHKLKKS